MMQRMLIAVFLILTMSTNYAQIATVRAEFSTDSVMIGEQFEFKISAVTDKDASILLPAYSDTISKELEIIQTNKPDTLFIDEKMEISQKHLVTSFHPGWNTVPPQPIVYSKDDLTDTLYTTAQLLTVLAPAVDTTQAFKPIKPPVNTPVSFAELAPWIITGLVALGIIFLAIWLIRRYRKNLKSPEELSIPAEPAHIVAFRELDELRREKLCQKGLVKEYYTKLTGIIRNYMARQFGIHAMESTSAEILQAFKTQNILDEKLNGRLENLLMLADLVKFAKEDPLMHENEEHLKNAEEFIEKTYRMFEDELSSGQKEEEILNDNKSAAEIITEETNE